MNRFVNLPTVKHALPTLRGEVDRTILNNRCFYYSWIVDQRDAHKKQFANEPEGLQ